MNKSHNSAFNCHRDNISDMLDELINYSKCCACNAVRNGNAAAWWNDRVRHKKEEVLKEVCLTALEGNPRSSRPLRCTRDSRLWGELTQSINLAPKGPPKQKSNMGK